MTYVPPKKESDKGGGGFGDIVYVMLFYLIEGLFIFIGIPFLIFAIGIIPLAMYAVITQGGGELGLDWVMILLGVIIVFVQILALQYFFRKYILQPNNMKFGQWLRWKFSPTEIKKRREEKQARSQKMEEWYESMDRIQDSKAKLVNEQSLNIRDEWFIEGDPDEIKMKEPEETGIIIGETIIEESYPTSSESEELTESEIIVLGSDESDENQ